MGGIAASEESHIDKQTNDAQEHRIDEGIANYYILLTRNNHWMASKREGKTRMLAPLWGRDSISSNYLTVTSLSKPSAKFILSEMLTTSPK